MKHQSVFSDSRCGNAGILPAVLEPTGRVCKVGFKAASPRVWTWILAAMIASSDLACFAAGPFTATDKSLVPAQAAVTNTPVLSLGGGRYQLGKVIFDKAGGSLQFPAVINMTNGVLEYLLVHHTGKIHESLLSTEAEPFHIHIAALLSGMSAQTHPAKVAAAPDGKPAAPRPLKLTLRWVSREGRTNEAPPDLWVIHKPTGKPMTAGPWVYAGSRILEGCFLAQRDGSIVALITDPDALVGNPRSDRDADDSWKVNSSSVPPVRSAVIVTLEPVNH